MSKSKPKEIEWNVVGEGTNNLTAWMTEMSAWGKRVRRDIKNLESVLDYACDAQHSRAEICAEWTAIKNSLGGAADPGDPPPPPPPGE